MTYTEEYLKNKLLKELEASYVEVIDHSDGCGGKFACVIVSEKFKGKPLLARHRLVNSALEEELKSIHAFSQKTFTPEQWEEQSITFKISAPGKVILNGEHSVVYGKLALAASINLRTTFKITEIDVPNTLILQCSSLEFAYKYNLQDVKDFLLKDPLPLLKDQKDYNLEFPQYLDHNALLLRVDDFLKQFHPTVLSANHLVSLKAIFYLLAGILGTTDLQLTSILMDCSTELNTGAGLGSSASFSVTIAASFINYVKSKILGNNLSKKCYKPSDWNFDLIKFTERELNFICQWSFCAEKIIHGTPSGLDNTICTYGFVVEFRKDTPSNKMKIAYPLNLLLINTNVSRETKRLVVKVCERRKQFPHIIDAILDSMDAVSKTVSINLEKLCTLTSIDDTIEVYKDLGEIWSINQNLLDALGVGHKKLTQIVHILAEYNLNGKLTGAGGGGYAICLIPPKFDSNILKKAITELEANGFGVIKTNSGVEGVRLESER